MGEMKPIEPGCQAMITRGSFAGALVFVGNRVTSNEVLGYTFHKDCDGKVWEIDRKIRWLHVHELRYVHVACCPERALMRIDDDDNEKLFKRK